MLLFSNMAIASDSIDKTPTFPAGKESKIILNLIDSNGTPVALGAGVKEVDFNYYFENKTEGKFFAESTDSIKSDLSEKGIAEIKVYSDRPGEYNVVFALTIRYNDARQQRMITKKLSLEFGEKKVKKTLALMYINSLENLSTYAAYIQEEKVYVPLINTLQLLGVEPRWNTANTITIDVNGKNHYINPSEKTLTLNDNKMNINLDLNFNESLNTYYVSTDILKTILDVEIEKNLDQRGNPKSINFIVYTNSIKK